MQETSARPTVKLREELDKLCNEFVEWKEFQGFERSGSPLGRELRRAMLNHHFIPTRRACWAYVQAASPIDVKQVIWEHEREELVKDPRIGVAHVDLVDEKDWREPLPGVKAACYAWLHLAKDRPWLEALAASHIVERQNDPTVIKDGKTSIWRAVDQLMAEQGIDRVEDLPIESRAHLNADTDHANLIWTVFERYVTDEESYQQVMRGARESLDVFRAYRQAVALGEREL